MEKKSFKFGGREMGNRAEGLFGKSECPFCGERHEAGAACDIQVGSARTYDFGYDPDGTGGATYECGNCGQKVEVGKYHFCLGESLDSEFKFVLELKPATEKKLDRLLDLFERLIEKIEEDE